MSKLYFCILLLTAAAIIGGANLAASANAENTGYAFVDSFNKIFGLQNSLSPDFTETVSALPSLVGVPISLPNVSATPGLLVVPVTTGDLTGLAAISYELQVTFDPSVVSPASPPFDKAGTISSGMSIFVNPNFPGHLIVVGFQAADLAGSGTLIYLRFNVVGAQGQSTALAFEDYTDPTSNPHPGFRFNEGDPAAKTSNGNVSIPAATPTNTASNTATNTPTFTPTPTATSTFTPTPTATATETFTPTPTATNTFTPTATNTATFTPTPTATNTFTPTTTSTETSTPTSTATNTSTPTATNTATFTPTPTEISGTVAYGNAVGSPNPRFVSDVQINAVGSPNFSTSSDFPGGNYSLGLFGPGPYTITPTKTGGLNNAINSFDAGRIAAHVSGSSILSGNQLIAADVSGNGAINSFDAAQIARFVTASGGSGTTGTWQFFTTSNIPFPPGTTPTSRTYSALTSNLTGEDYTGILMGEVSGNWQNTAARPEGSSQKVVGSSAGDVSALTWEKILFNEGEPRTIAANGELKIEN